ncbi:MAG: HipA domain-containing protein [Clostridia bacterium]|nr:HipA domain-containing protein [Clostridia bacterium]
MNCLCCGKPLRSNTEQYGWHKSCIRNFFGTESIPEIEFDNRTLELLATETTQKGLTVPGVQKKLSLHLLSGDNNPRLTLVNYPTGYILKPQVSEFSSLPESEQLVMSMADVCGIATVPHALIEQNGTFAYITKRVDRIISEDHIGLIAMEDFCQLDERLTQDKYKGSYERCAKIIQRFSSKVGYDLSELFMRIVFCFITGNSDMHLKNFSLIETFEGSAEYVLSPAYDLLPVNIIMPEDKEETALTLNGKKKNIRRKDFLVFAEGCGLTQSAAGKMIDMLVSKKQKLLDMCASSLLPEEMKVQFLDLIEARIYTLTL